MALITGFGLFIVAVLTVALHRILAEEIEAWSPSIIRSVIKLAVRRLPESQRERFDEEWQSHVNDVPGKVGKILVAAGFLFAAHNMALTDWRNQTLEGLWRGIAKLDEQHSTITTLVNLIQNDEALPLRELLLPHANVLRFHRDKCQELRNGLAADIALASAYPQTLVNNLCWALYTSRIQRECEQMSQAVSRMIEDYTTLVKRVEAIRMTARSRRLKLKAAGKPELP